MNSIKLSAPATVANVGPGYDIFAMALEDPRDEFEMRLNSNGQIRIEISGNHQNIPVSVGDNTGGLALQQLFQAKKIKQGVDVFILKKMTSGGGLGTTGATAAACIYGINKLLDLGMNDDELIDFARMGEVASGGSPHADNVSAALLGGFTLVKSYKPLKVLKLDLPPFPLALAIVRKSQRTTRGFITYEIGQEKLKEQIARCSTVIHAIHMRDIAEFGSAISVDHIAEPVRGSAIPGYYDIKNAVIEAGAWGCNISGGGSSVFAICPSAKIESIAKQMHNHFTGNPNFDKVIITKTSNEGVREIG